MTDRGLMRRYLLGTASPDERTTLEDKYLRDTGAFEELTAAENDLIDSYTRGKLSDIEKVEFEKRYLTSPKGRSRVSFSRALAELSAQPHQTNSAPTPSFWQGILAFFQPRSPVFRWGFAAVCAVALVAAIGSLRVIHNRNLQARLGSQQTNSQTQVNIATQPNAQTPGGTGRTEIAKTETPLLGEFTLQLNSGISRTFGSGAPKPFVVPPGTSWLNLQLGLDDDDHSGYVVSVETPEGVEIRRVEGLNSRTRSGRKIIVVRVPARLIPAGDYVVDVKRTGEDKTKEQSVESYAFRIVYK